MSEEVKQHLFEPFFTTKEVGEGSGMGLASVYGTVRNHAGSIAVTSDVGQGTTFRICLPHVPSAPKAKPKRQVVRPSRGSAQILLVDDERTVREMGAALLEDLGYRVASCADGQEAVEYYREHWKEVDLVILDMIMPRMGGREAFIAMQQINPQIRAVLSSGYSVEKGAQDVLQLGVLGFIGKPYEQSQLAREVEEALAHSAS
jgi:CheY-like chemotaxis protein